jgi:hypothetical protein
MKGHAVEGGWPRFGAAARGQKSGKQRAHAAKAESTSGTCAHGGVPGCCLPQGQGKQKSNWTAKRWVGDLYLREGTRSRLLETSDPLSAAPARTAAGAAMEGAA